MVLVSFVPLQNSYSSTFCDPAKLENCNKNKIELCVCVCQDLLRYPDSEAYLLGPFFSRAKILPFPVTFLSKLGKSAREPVIDAKIIDGFRTLIYSLKHFVASLSQIIIAVSSSHCRRCTVNDPLK